MALCKGCVQRSLHSIWWDAVRAFLGVFLGRRGLQHPASPAVIGVASAVIAPLTVKCCNMFVQCTAAGSCWSNSF
jgi:hypothetical protein